MQQLDELVGNIKSALIREGLLSKPCNPSSQRQDQYTEYLLEDIPKTTRSALQKKICLQAQGYCQPLVLELASWYGHNGAGWIAKRVPKAEVRLVSKTEDVNFPFGDFLFNRLTYRNTDLYFEKGQELYLEEDIEKRINKLYHNNGITNVNFYGHTLTFDDVSINSPIQNSQLFYLQKKDSQSMIIMGYEAPVEVPFIATQLYNQQKANMLVISPSGTELLLPDSPAWNIIQQELGFTNSELHYFKLNTQDEELEKTRDFSKQKYDYTNPIQRRQGQLLKMTIAAALAQSVHGKIMRDSDRGFQVEDDLHNYNKPDFYIVAQR